MALCQATKETFVASSEMRVNDQANHWFGRTHGPMARVTLKAAPARGEIALRQARPGDASTLRALLDRLDRETPYLGFVPGERSPHFLATQQQIIEDPTEANGAIFLTFSGADAVGFLQAEVCPLLRYRHCLTIAIGVLQTHAGAGIGRRLFEAAEAWARARRIHRLELTVATHNERAIALYMKSGFAIEGRLRHAVVVDGQYVDDYIMAKLIDS